MAEINTRIILRNDTAEAWKNSELKLKGGEAAVEVVNGKAKLKIATTDNQSFADAPYIGGAEANVFQIELTADETDIEAAIEEEVGDTELAIGDIAIVKAPIADGKYSYTSYIYEKFVNAETNAETFAWTAMDGNYNAANVYTQKDITLTSAVGNYAKDYKINAGTSLETLLSGLLQKEEEPGTPSKPTASISVSGNNGEVGAEYTVPTAKLSIGGVGSYTYGPATGIVFNIGDIKLAEGAEPTTASNYVTNSAQVSAKTNNLLSLKATGDKVKYVDGDTKYTFSGSAAYQAATASPVTNLGNPSKTQSAIAAGSCTISDQTATFTGWRKMFMGAVAKTATINSATIRGIGNATTTNVISEKAVKNTAKTFTAPVGTEKILIAWPRSLSTSAPTVEYFTMSWEGFGDFALAAEKVKVADAAGVTLADSNTKDEYIVYAYTPADPLKADTQFRVTLK